MAASPPPKTEGPDRQLVTAPASPPFTNATSSSTPDARAETAAPQLEAGRKASVLRHPDVISAFIGIIPGIVTVIALAFVLFLFREAISRMIPRVSGVEAFGLKVSLIDVKGWAAGANKGRDLGITDSELKSALDRGAEASAAYAGSKLLWVDDHPEYNVWERRALTALGADVTVVISNAEARDRMLRAEFDVLISDLRRDNGEDAREIPRSLDGKTYRPEVIYYVFQKENTPVPEAFAITTRPDQLVQLVTDVLERRRHQRPGSQTAT